MTHTKSRQDTFFSLQFNDIRGRVAFGKTC
jgi:hypothetical protein